MWMLNFIPDALLELIIHAVTGLGVLGIILGFMAGIIPWLKPQSSVIKIVGTVLLLVGLYFEGGLGVEQAWRQRVAALEEQIAASQQQSTETNVVVQTKYLERVKVVKEQQQVIVEKIKEVEKLVDAKCEVAEEAIVILNEAAQDPRSKP